MDQTSQTTKPRTAIDYARVTLCMLLTVVLAAGLMPILPHEKAFAADGERAESVILQLYDQNSQIDVAKQVATLDANMGKGIIIPFSIRDKYENWATSDKRRKLVLVDASGKETQVGESITNSVGMSSDSIVAGSKLKLVTMVKGKSGNLEKAYEQQLNVRFIDKKKAEQKPSSASPGTTPSGTTPAGAGISDDGSSWSFSNGLQYTFKNTGFSFLDNTTMTLGALKLPLQYKHKSDGTTIVGINVSPEDEAFFKAVKNGNVWQKYSTEELVKKTSQMDKGWSGKKFGTWGGKGFDWNVCGYMEFNTKDPNAPRAVNLIISMGMKAEGHAQYLCFTGTLTFTIGGKAVLVGKLTPGQGVSGKFGLGAYAGLELYIGLGLQYVASVGAYGKGQINIDFQVLPSFYLDKVTLSGEMGAKAKVFGFTVYTWKILSGSTPLYSHDGEKKNGDGAKKNKDGSAVSPFEVDADTPYPVDSRAYLDSSALAVGSSDALGTQASADSSTILKGIYGETELTTVTTNDGPVIAYIADAKQIDPSSQRDAVNRSALVYSRYKNGKWTDPKIIDTTEKTGKFADYSPTISTDGENCYVSWLAANSKIAEGATIGDVGKKLDVNVATITKDDKITVEVVSQESSEAGSMPASPKAVKAGNDLYVGWYTNQTTGKNGEVIGVSGEHKFRMFKKGEKGWALARETSAQKGAITSFDVGMYGNTPTVAWSIDEKFEYANVATPFNGVDATKLAESTVYVMTPDSSEAKIVATSATNAQFAKSNGADVLTYAIRVDPNDNKQEAYLSVQGSSGVGQPATVVLDGSKVYLPTTYYELAGDFGKGRMGNISFLAAGGGTSDIRALVTTGAGSADWTSIVEATADSNVVTDYCATYVDGKPLFVYATERASAANGSMLRAQADDDGSVDLNMTTDSSLQHLSIFDIDYDEYAVKTGETMPITAYFTNDGMLDVSGVDLWMLENGQATKVATLDKALEIDSDGEIKFDYTVPAKETFKKEHELVLYAAPKGAPINSDKILREKNNDSAMSVLFGDASLTLEVEHRIIDDQESIAASVTNEGIAPHSARMLFINSDTGETIYSADVPELGEYESFNAQMDAKDGYFQKEGLKNVIITLENDGSDASDAGYYEINNTEFVSTWELGAESETPPAASDPGDGSGAQTAKAGSGSGPGSGKSGLPGTGDQITIGLMLALLAIALVASPFVVRTIRRTREE